MYTRIIEHKGFMYHGVDEVSLRSRSGKSLVFDAVGLTRIKGGCSSGSDMFEEKHYKAGNAKKTLCIDIERRDIFRIRFSEGEVVPENYTPMVVNDFDGSSDFLLTENDAEYRINTGTYILVIGKKPYFLTIYDCKGKKRFGASKGECNDFEVLDSLNLGTVKGSGEVLKPFTPAPPQFEYQVGNPDVPLSVDSFELGSDEHVYGLGENFIGLDKKYQTIDLWTQDALGPVSARTYKPVPFFVSSKKYGIYVNSHAPMTFWIGSLSCVRTVLAVEEEFLDYYIILGDTMRQVISGYTDITGHSAMPPKWSFGFWLSKLTYHSDAETSEIAAEMRKRKLPFDVLHLDTHWFEKDWVCDLEFSKTNFPDPEGYFRRMAEKGVHISLWQLPYMDSRSKLFNEALENGFFPVKDGKPAIFIRDEKVSFGVLDITNPEMLEWWKEKLRRLFRLGASAIKVDFGEGAPADCTYCNGMKGRKLHNLYPLLYNKAIFEVTSEFTDRPFIWARSCWAGSQRYPLHWGGDNSGYFEQLVPQLTGGLSLAFCGFPFWSQDIGGFYTEVNDLELYIRWFQVGLFMSHPRLHGIGSREPYRFGEEVESSVRRLLNLRYRLMPYIYSSAWACVEDRSSFISPLVLEFEDDPNTTNIGDQFMFGPYIMVAPFTDKGGSRKLYLPEGTWYDFWTGKELDGGRWISVTMDIDHFPLYAKSGAIIPMGPEMQYVGEKVCDPLTLLLYPGEKGTEFSYHDDNETFRIKLEGRKLYISPVTGHKLDIRIYAEGVMEKLFVNGKPFKFVKEKDQIYFSYECDGSYITAEWF